ncbi:MAG: hypothetical protein PVI21_04125 [Candidatus Woesebacteria bacterium]|jgi:hypothetical protein
MQDGSAGAKQQIVDRIKQSTNILVTVSSNPSVDALSALLAFSLMLNKLDKHATSVFSGVVPPAINFLEPAKSFEHDVDSLRDFIIALDKEKADRLRYKVENDVVKIYITPYRTTLTQNDLQFSQGDFNVDLIIALGVEKREELDGAIVAHGRILHDAAVMTINAANQKSSLGSVDWQDSNASSLCEMMVGIGEALQPNIFDQQISTALLTGIVAATERFSNVRTTSNVMTVAAKLMATGANQQLIAANLTAQAAVAPAAKPSEVVDLPAGVSAKVSAKKPDGEMQIRHEEKPKQPEPVKVPEPEIPVATPAAASFDELKKAITTDTKLQDQATKDKTKINAYQPARKEVKPPKREGESYITSKPSWMGRNIQPPTMGGTLSATAEEALESKMREEMDSRNRTLLSHDEQATAEKNEAAAPQVGEPTPVESQQPSIETQSVAASESAVTPEPVSQSVVEQNNAPEDTASAISQVPLQTEPSLEELERQAKEHAARAPEQPQTVNAAREAVDAALATAPPMPGEAVQSIGVQDFPATKPVQESPAQTADDIQQLNQQVAGLALPSVQSPEVSLSAEQPAAAPISTTQSAQDSQALPPLPPMPDFSTLPPEPAISQIPQPTPAEQPQASVQAPSIPEAYTMPTTQNPTPVEPAQPVSTDPRQYQIPTV